MISIERAVERALKNAEIKVAAGWKRPCPPPKKQTQVLVVDDDLGVRQTLTLLLATAGYETSAAHNGFEALQMIKRKAPRLLLCDLDMPDHVRPRISHHCPPAVSTDSGDSHERLL